jgi:putative membrane protein
MVIKDSPYHRSDSEELSLTDSLAVDRTILANERTLLAYLRSGVAMILTGVTFIAVFPSGYVAWLGMGCIPVGVVVVVVGVLRWVGMRQSIGCLGDQLKGEP